MKTAEVIESILVRCVMTCFSWLLVSIRYTVHP